MRSYAIMSLCIGCCSFIFGLVFKRKSQVLPLTACKARRHQNGAGRNWRWKFWRKIGCRSDQLLVQDTGGGLLGPDCWGFESWGRRAGSSRVAGSKGGRRPVAPSCRAQQAELPSSTSRRERERQERGRELKSLRRESSIWRKACLWDQLVGLRPVAGESCFHYCFVLTISEMKKLRFYAAA